MPQVRPLFTATAGSSKHIWLLLRCINFATKTQVQISEDGLRFSVEDASAMEGLAFLEKSLFTSYKYTPANDVARPPSRDSEHSDDHPPANHSFTLSLAALLECLQILSMPQGPNAFGNSGFNPTFGGGSSHAFPSGGAGGPAHIFSHSSGAHCHLMQRAIGDPFTVTLTEQNVTTTCELTTYDPPRASHLYYNDNSDSDNEGGRLATGDNIPFARDRLALKIIMRPAALLGALNELAATGNPERLLIQASVSRGPKSGLRHRGGPAAAARTLTHTLSLKGEGPLGSALVEFNTSPSSSSSAPNSSTSFSDAAAAADAPPPPSAEGPQHEILETFLAPSGVGAVTSRRNEAREGGQRTTFFTSTYRFAHLLAARRAMAAAEKVSVRADGQGVLSLQFMIAVDSSASLSAGGGGAGWNAGNGGSRDANGSGSGRAQQQQEVSFVDFRFVPLVEEDEDEQEEGEDGGGEYDDDDDNDDGRSD